jgi:NHLM bacteriocin system ABC transporter peptidase/ATP-binding protein
MTQNPAQQPKEKRSWPNVRRRKTPTVLQMEAVECGAAALGIMLGYYGRFVPLEKLRQDCGVSRDGSKASNVTKAARRYGLKAQGYKKEMESLLQMQMPVIVFWNFNHFLVLEGIRNGRAYLNDPAIGPRSVAMEEFDDSFTGVVIELLPGPEFKPGGRKQGMLPALLPRLQNSKLALGFLLLTGLFLVLPGLVVPAFSKIFIDQYLIGQREYWVRPLLVVMGVTIVVLGILNYLQQYFLLRLQTKLALSSSARFFSHVLRLPVDFFAQRYAGEIGTRVEINDSVANTLAGPVTKSVLDAFLVVFYMVLMLLYDVPLTLCCVSVILLNVVAMKMTARGRKDISRRKVQETGKLMGTAMGGLQMMETLKATGGESDYFRRWSGYQAKSLDATQQLGLYDKTMGIVSALLGTLSTSVVLGMGGLRVMSGNLTIGDLVAFQALLGAFGSPIGNLTQLGSTLQLMEGDMNRLDDVLRYEVDPQTVENPEQIAMEKTGPLAGTIKLSGMLELRNLTFGYSRLEGPLIRDFNLTLRPGARVALIGASGSGKSTVAKVVSGLYDPWDGEILYDGVPRKQIPRHLMCSSVAMVDQDIFLFEGTTRENISMWDHTMPDINIIKALEDACIDDVIESRPGGYDSMIAEGGANFSGGQRQRLEIARALVNSPTLLVLDEATSALDPLTEKRIDENLRRRGCACLIIAHRLSTIRDCDEIIVMERGRIVQRGTHDSMKSADGPYATLIKVT